MFSIFGGCAFSDVELGVECGAVGQVDDRESALRKQNVTKYILILLNVNLVDQNLSSRSSSLAVTKIDFEIDFLSDFPSFLQRFYEALRIVNETNETIETRLTQ